mgnify:FL=1
MAALNNGVDNKKVLVVGELLQTGRRAVVDGVGRVRQLWQVRQGGVEDLLLQSSVISLSARAATCGRGGALNELPQRQLSDIS